MIDENIRKFIDEKSEVMNKDALFHCDLVSNYIKQLNAFIAGEIILSEERIFSLLDHLIKYHTITLELFIDDSAKLLRATKFNQVGVKPYFNNVSRLSYIPLNSSITPSLGRMNVHGKSMYYGCICLADPLEKINVAFAEVNAQKYEKINILVSNIQKELKINFIGVYDYVKQNMKPNFFPEKSFLYFRNVYEYYEEKYDKFLMLSFQLCDAFFSDILSREGSERLYIVTSMLSKLFLEGDRIDGLIYYSVKAMGSPVIAIKPQSVNEKIIHTQALSFDIQEYYGYANYYAKPTYQGTINGEDINWSKFRQTS